MPCHFLCVAELVTVGGAAKRDEDGGTTCGGDFCCGDSSCSTHNHICPAKAFRHMSKESHNLRVNFMPRVCRTHGVIITLPCLMHDGQLVLSRREAVHGIHNSTIDGQRALTTAGNQEAKWLCCRARHEGEKFLTHRTSRDDSLRSPGACRNFITGGDSCRNFSEHLVGETRLCVGLEDHVWYVT